MKSKNVLDVVESISIALGVVVSIETIYTILGIVLLAFQIGLILYKVIKSIVEHAKHKEYDEIEHDIEKGIEDIENVIEKHGNETDK